LGACIYESPVLWAPSVDAALQFMIVWGAKQRFKKL